MKQAVALTLTLAMTVGLGCEKKTDRMGRVRPPVDELSDNGRGLQGKDVVSASDKMAQSLLALPDLNASQQQWTIVVDHVDNLSTTQRQNLDIFLLRLRSRIAQLGRGRVQLIENRDKLRELQSRELDQPADRFGQGGTAVPAPGVPIQPDFALSAKLADLPNRDSTYFLCEFTLTNLKNRTIAWDDMYEVSTGR
ncbi:MAG: hypothetical protein ACTHLZ_04600 [Tepidisphaeraceae bacterium]